MFPKRLWVFAALFCCASIIYFLWPDRERRESPGSAGQGSAPVATPRPLSLGKPLPPVPPSLGQTQHSWTNAQLIAEERESTDNGLITRVRIISPPGLDAVRVEETLARNEDGEEVVTGRLEMAAGHVLVRPKAGVALRDIVNRLQSAGVVDAEVVSGGLARLNLKEHSPRSVPAILAAVDAAGDLVEYIEPDYVAHATVLPNDPSFVNGQLWGLENTGQSGGVVDADIDAPDAWDLRQDASSIIVGVVDTGVRYTHEDLAANMWVNTHEIAGDGLDNDGNGVVDDIYGFNAMTRSGNPSDDNGHGTHVAGTIGARGQNSIGTVGVAWRVQLMALKFLGADGSGFTSAAVAAIDYARIHGARVLNNSWGSSGYSQSLADAVERCRSAGIIFVAAAGNDGSSSDLMPFYPAALSHDNVVSVAASTRSDTLAAFSNYGLRTVDIAAPGAAIFSAHHLTDSSYTTLSGTSMASPHVAGAMALLCAHFPGATHSELIERLLATADHPSALSLRVRSEGRMNIARALSAATIVSLPRIVQQPQPLSVLAGAAAGFSVTASGGGELAYQWRLNGFDIAGGTNATFSLSNAQGTNAGRYTVLVRNSSGVILSEEAALAVLQPIAITSQPAGSTVVEGLTFTVNVVATGDQPITYQWRKNNAAIAGATGSKFSIFGVKELDSGNYSVLVSNPVSSLVSSPAALLVQSPPRITAQPQDQVVAVGGSAAFNVAAAEGGAGPLAYQWFKDGVAIAGATLSALSIGPLQAEAIASYSVRLTNFIGTTWSRGASLTLTNAGASADYPQFTTQPLDQTVRNGTNVTLSALASPADVSYSWRKDGAPIPGATTSALSLAGVSSSSAGFYSVVASNGQGIASSRQARLVIAEAPVITQHPKSIAADPGAQVALEVTATGTAPMQYQWFKDSQALTGATHDRLVIDSLGSVNTGTYYVKVQNAAGAVLSLSVTVSLSSKSVTSWRQIEPGLDMSHQMCAMGAPDGIYTGSTDGGLSFSADGGATWQYRRPALTPGETLRGLAYGNGVYVGSGTSNNSPFSITSADGINWKRHWVPFTGALDDIKHDGSSFYGVVGASGLMRSSDGITWNYQGFGVGTYISVARGAGLYVAVGSQGGMKSSPDGVTWTAVTSPTTKHLRAICYGDDGFVAVGWGAIIKSIDGVNWEVVPSVTSQELHGVVAGNGRYVAVGGSIFTGAIQQPVTLVSDDGVTWRRTSNRAQDNLENVAFGNGMFIATGGSGIIMTSSDGEQWVLRVPPHTTRLRGLAYNTNVFVAVGENGMIRNSEDGLNWVTSRPPMSENFYAVEYGGGRFVIGVQDGAVYTSSDRVAWQRLPTGAGAIDCIRYLNNQFFALADSGEILTSTDASSWTRFSAPTGAPLKGIVWTGSQYVVAGFDGTILTSPDGQVWTRRPTPTLQHLNAVSYGNELYIAVGAAGCVLRSTNAVDWTLGNAGTNTLNGVAFGNGVFVAAGFNGAVYKSTNGISWSSINSTASFYTVRFINGRFVVAGSGSYMTSTDGQSWTTGSADYFEDVTYGNGLYVGVGYFGRLYTAPSFPASWTRGSVGSLTSYILTDVQFQNGRFVACGRNGNILTSADGLGWAKQNSGWTSGIERLAYGAGRHVAVGTSGVILHSANATNWSLVTVSGVSQWNDVVYGGGQFVAAGYPGGIATSPNGTTWTRQTSPSSTQFNTVAYGNGMYVLGGFSGEIVTSPDGVTWAVQYVASGENLGAATFYNGQFHISGGSGNIYSSTNGLTWTRTKRNSSLTVYDLVGYDGAMFAVGQSGTISVSAPLPAIISQPASQEIRIGAPAALSVIATNPGVVYYQWFKNGQPVAGETTSTLTRLQARTADAGTYFVRVTGLGGTMDSIAAVLTVTQTPIDAWRMLHFGEEAILDPSRESSLWGLDADPDGDRIVNLVEYALGLNPGGYEDSTGMTASVVNGKLRVTYKQRRDDAGLQVTPQITNDLVSWRGGSTNILVTSAPFNAELDQIYAEAVHDAPVPGAQFLRLLVSITP